MERKDLLGKSVDLETCYAANSLQAPGVLDVAAEPFYLTMYALDSPGVNFKL
jgi:hypothetical protein